MYHKNYDRVNKDKESTPVWVKQALTATSTYRLIAAYNQVRLGKTYKGTISNIDAAQIAEKVYPEQYKRNTRLATMRVQRMLKVKEIREIADKSLAQVLMDNGINVEYVIKRRKDIMDRAKDAEKLDTELKALQGLESLLPELQPIQQQQITTSQDDIDFSRYLEDGDTPSLISQGGGMGITTPSTSTGTVASVSTSAAQPEQPAQLVPPVPPVQSAQLVPPVPPVQSAQSVQSVPPVQSAQPQEAQQS